MIVLMQEGVEVVAGASYSEAAGTQRSVENIKAQGQRGRPGGQKDDHKSRRQPV